MIDSPVIGLIDADGFFASCELSRNPHLRGKPVLIVGRIGAFVLAKSQEARAMGVKTVMPLHEAKRLCPNGILINGDFRFYTLMSRRLMKIIKQWSPSVQVSSIDEAYVDFTGIDKMMGKTFEEIGDDIRREVYSQLGITISIGISVNKVLAKMACEKKKPNGTSVLLKKDIPPFLSTIEIGDVPGIGRRRQEAIKKYQIRYAGQMRDLPMGSIKQLFGRNGIMLWKELRGEYMFRINADDRIPKQIGRTSSLYKPTSDLKEIEGLAFYHLERAIESLHRYKLTAGEVNLYLRSKDFKRYHFSHLFREPTDDFFCIARALNQLVKDMPKGLMWRSAGILFTNLNSNKVRQLNLFDGLEKLVREEKINEAKNDLNKRYGQFTVTNGSTLFYERKKLGKDERLGLI